MSTALAQDDIRMILENKTRESKHFE